ncbi:hypothetical protein GW17_00010470 [Ensete ventricosum]|nr:hypothetical protein GW17_00010470 [Ensete ventricosum]
MRMSGPQFHIFMHFAELQPLAVGQPRNFTVDLNGNPWWHPFSPTYLLSDYLYSTSPYDMYQYNFSIKKTATSTLPPIINALETYTVMQLTENATDSSDELNKGFITGIWFLSLVTARIETIWHLSMSTCLKGHYEINCKRSQQRPAMADVVLQLKESLELQTSRDRITSSGERYMEGGVSIGSSPYVVEMTLVSGGPSAR